MHRHDFAPLGDLCDPSRGITYGIVKVGDFIPDGVPVIRGGDIRAGKIVFDDKKRVSKEVSNEFARTILRGGEILINLISEPGHTAIVPLEMAGFNISRDVALIPLGNAVDHRYVDYYLKSRAAVDWLASRLQGSVTQKINLGVLRDLPVPNLPLTQQRGIADVLSALDEKIELNRQMNETLEAMSQAIFRDWFVDFHPTRRKLAGETDPVEIIGGLTRDPVGAADLARLFPSHLDERDVPMGWVARPLDQVAEFLNGLALQKFPAAEDEASLPAIKIAELRSGLSERSDRVSRRVPERYIIKDGDYIFSWSGSLLAKVWTEGEGALNQHLFKVTSAEYPQWFYAGWVQYHLPEFQRIAASKATTMGHIQRSHLIAAVTVCPPGQTIESMSVVLGPLWQRMIHNSVEARMLAETRDYLLPRLMSGAVRVDEAEEATTAALARAC